MPARRSTVPESTILPVREIDWKYIVEPATSSIEQMSSDRPRPGMRRTEGGGIPVPARVIAGDVGDSQVVPEVYLAAGVTQRMASEVLVDQDGRSLVVMVEDPAAGERVDRQRPVA